MSNLAKITALKYCIDYVKEIVIEMQLLLTEAISD